ncbi:helix-turn-helix domain-containing protein [Jeotgalibacillus soli]|uniref:Helicase Helix-turn-helix domain-containing protein n=1 Tax=Jeotgalibacillus soli TaxID=889306 RepID=A0A0C2V5F2_9BACL|nr:helix-turn-helix domain-containing protein [Jeotgalibacillus soli]KIL44232.1 hypothetical protein KP78_31960 [Jeotgalibacillus soli]
MTYLEAILLTCFRAFKGDRSHSAVFHLLTGKKTSQTIQDAHLYEVTEFFQVFPSLSRERFDHNVSSLREKGYLLEKGKDRYDITETAKIQVDDFFLNHIFPSNLKGWAYHDQATLFWRRLTLLVQSLSNFNHDEQRFYPVQRDPNIQGWVRKTFNSWKNNRKHWTENLHKELSFICHQETFPDKQDWLIHQLSGYKLVGETLQQLAMHFNVNEDEAHFRFLNIVHYSIGIINNNPQKCRLLRYILQDGIEKSLVLTSSTEKTYHLVKKNKLINEIALLRRLKESTIEDHIIELALMVPDFPIDSYVNPPLQKEIRSVVSRANHSRLREMKEQLPGVSFFQIRLVLVKDRRENNKWKSYLKKYSDTAHSEKGKKK